MKQTEASKLLAQLAAEYTVAPFDPDLDITASDLVRETGITRESAQKKLNAMVAAGQLEKRIVKFPGQRPTTAYRRASS